MGLKYIFFNLIISFWYINIIKGGYCPAGAVTAAFSGQTEPILTLLSMFTGWCAAHVIKGEFKWLLIIYIYT